MSFDGNYEFVAAALNPDRVANWCLPGPSTCASPTYVVELPKWVQTCGLSVGLSILNVAHIVDATPINMQVMDEEVEEE
ncbi:hypothetical protein VNO78_33533 [Psophocarpus tetragonolobus]|uniref:Uncharacterized protein n=1 Tax=Psophocarpus tetragonolobus TaxID=3891 RepID=A0AAN9NYH0_PSOTE